METKLPYYMMYPTPFLFDDEKIEERDYEYLRSMYPEMAKQILPYVEDECDRMEYENSMIYDEYPDKLQLRLMGRRIYDRVMEQEKFAELEAEEAGTKEVEAEALSGRQRKRNVNKKRHDRVRDMVELLLYQELFRRRGTHRRERRKRIW